MYVYADEVHELKDQLHHSKQSVGDLEKLSRRYESERDSLQGTVEGMESALQQKESKIEQALRDVICIRHEMDKQISEKDEELQNVR